MFDGSTDFYGRYVMRTAVFFLVTATLPLMVAANESLVSDSRAVCQALDLAYGTTVGVEAAYVADVAATPDMKQKFLEHASKMYRGKGAIGPSVKALALNLYNSTIAGAPQRLQETTQFLKQMNSATDENLKRARVDAFNGNFLSDCMYELGKLEGQNKLREFLSLQPNG
jgi:hypothetical protein